MVVLLLYFASRYQKSIKRLNNLSEEIANGTPLPRGSKFPRAKWALSANRYSTYLREKEEAIEGIQEAPERLILHFRMARVGIALFNHDGEVESLPTTAIQYANMLTTGSMTDAGELLNEPALLPVKQFLLQGTTAPKGAFLPSPCTKQPHFAVKALKSHTTVALNSPLKT